MGSKRPGRTLLPHRFGMTFTRFSRDASAAKLYVFCRLEEILVLCDCHHPSHPRSAISLYRKTSKGMCTLHRDGFSGLNGLLPFSTGPSHRSSIISLQQCPDITPSSSIVIVIPLQLTLNHLWHDGGPQNGPSAKLHQSTSSCHDCSVRYDRTDDRGFVECH